jgi:TetR/AcrR family transcriptional regulator
MKVLTLKSRLGTRGSPEQSRAAILQAAVREFAEKGIAGARTDAIAQAASVNKALLYYYFRSKDDLYVAVIDQVFAGLKQRVFTALAQDVSPRQKILGYVTAYFDYIASHPLYPKLVQREMMTAARGPSSTLQHVVRDYFRPISARLIEVINDGIESGEFRSVHPRHFVLSMVGIITFYFSNAPVIQMITGLNPLAPERVSERRQAVIDVISAALFVPPCPAKGGRA